MRARTESRRFGEYDKNFEKVLREKDRKEYIRLRKNT